MQNNTYTPKVGVTANGFGAAVWRDKNVLKLTVMMAAQKKKLNSTI